MIPNLLVAGEAVGGIHGRNRLMGNSLLDIIVFGRNAGKAAAARSKEVELGRMNLDHLQKYAEELEAAGHVFRAICRNVSGSQAAQADRGQAAQSE